MIALLSALLVLAIIATSIAAAKAGRHAKPTYAAAFAIGVIVASLLSAVRYPDAPAWFSLLFGLLLTGPGALWAWRTYWRSDLKRD